jgi:hypothetical protein
MRRYLSKARGRRNALLLEGTLPIDCLHREHLPICMFMDCHIFWQVSAIYCAVVSLSVVPVAVTVELLAAFLDEADCQHAG